MGGSRVTPPSLGRPEPSRSAASLTAAAQVRPPLVPVFHGAEPSGDRGVRAYTRRAYYGKTSLPLFAVRITGLRKNSPHRFFFYNRYILPSDIPGDWITVSVVRR